MGGSVSQARGPQLELGSSFDIRRFHNVGVTVPAGVRGTDLTLEVRNLADETFEDIMGYPLPGRSVYGTVAVDF